MRAIGSDELKEALQGISSGNARKAAEGIAIAAGIESESIDFYARQAKKFKGTETEQFFNFLREQEEGHLAAINSLKETLEKDGRWTSPKLPENKRPEIFSKKDWDKGVEDGLTAVLFALWKEKQAQEFYESIALRLKDKDAVGFFKALALFEKGHAEMLSEYVEDSYYTRELIMG